MAAIIEQKAFRFRDDSTALNTDGGWLAALNTDLSDVDITSDVFYRLRVVLENDGDTGLPATSDYALQYRVNSGTWYNVGLGTGVDTALSSIVANAATTTQLIGSGTFTTGEFREGGVSILDRELPVGYEIENEWALQLTATELSAGDVIDFRVLYDSTAPDTVTQTPTVTIASNTVIYKTRNVTGTVDKDVGKSITAIMRRDI